jgi:hypothetical protein
MSVRYKIVLLVVLAIAGAAWLTPSEPEPSYEEQLIGVALRQSFGPAASALETQPSEIQALLVDYADDPALVLQARLALVKYPDLARRLLPLYGGEPEFREVLRDYGPAVLPPIGYFMDHTLASLQVRRALGDQWKQVEQIFDRWLGSSGTEPTEGDSRTQAPTPELTPFERGWYAIAFLHEAGYDFIGQFDVARDGKVEWIQTERVAEALSDLLSGGVRTLETKLRQGQDIQVGDVGWAALDVAAFAASVKLAKALTAVRTAKAASVATGAAARIGFSERVVLFGSRALANGSRLGVAVARYGAIPASVYLMVRHPTLVNATLGELADWLGIDPWAVQAPFWFVALYALGRLALYLLWPLSRALQGLSWATRRMALNSRLPGRRAEE